MASPFWIKKACSRLGLARYLPDARRHTGGEPAFAAYYSDRVLAAPLDDLLDPTAFSGSVAPDVLNLNLAAPSYDSAYERSAGNPAAHDPRGSRELRTAVADAVRLRHGGAFNPDDNVALTHGATGAFANALDAFVNPGDGVVLFAPCSPLFRIGAASRRARVRWVPTWNDNGRCRFLIEGLARAMRRAKMLVLANPSNPTGGVLGREEWDRIAWLAKRQDTLVYADESFGGYTDDRAASPPTDDGFRRRLLTAGSVSQTFGMAATRVGWLTGPKQLVDACRLTQVLSAPYIPDACQAAALKALQTPAELFRPTLELFRKRRQYAVERLKGMGLVPQWPQGGFTLWVDVSGTGLGSREFVERLLSEEHVLVGNGEVFGPGGKGHIRISYAAEEGRLREGLNRLAAFIDRLTGREAVRTEPLAIATRQPALSELLPAFSRG